MKKESWRHRLPFITTTIKMSPNSWLWYAALKSTKSMPPLINSLTLLHANPRSHTAPLLRQLLKKIMKKFKFKSNSFSLCLSKKDWPNFIQSKKLIKTVSLNKENPASVEQLPSCSTKMTQLIWATKERSILANTLLCRLSKMSLCMS